MLVDTRDMGVRALVGSADYFDAGIHGQVNGIAAKRSPGSTLKPFIYALALDQGVLHPATVLRDVPTAFGPYTPENFDGRFLGPVTATDALVRSRNIPAVGGRRAAHAAELLRIPAPRRHRRTWPASSTTAWRWCSAAARSSMEELARLYAMLGNDGRLRSLRWRDERSGKKSGTSLLSPEAAFITRDMLRQQPASRRGALFATRSRPCRWPGRPARPGASATPGARAWSGPYALVVWLGNFDGSGNPALVGVDAAAPLFFEIVDGLQAGARRPGRAARGNGRCNLKRVEICRASGDLPNAWCPQRGDTWFIPGKSPIRVSRVHRAVAVDRAHRPRRLRAVRSARRCAMQVFEYWPSDLARVFAQAGIPRRRPPPDSDCAACAGLARFGAAASPRPTARPATRCGCRIRSRSQLQPGRHRRCRRVAAVLVCRRQLHRRSAAGDPVAWTPPHAGRFRLSVVDDHGRQDAREIEVAVVQ